MPTRRFVLQQRFHWFSLIRVLSVIRGSKKLFHRQVHERGCQDQFIASSLVCSNTPLTSRTGAVFCWNQDDPSNEMVASDLTRSAVPTQTTELAGHCFLWSKGKVGLPLGYGALYNHSYDPNAEYLDRTPQTKVYRAIQDIAQGEEITINYNGTPDDRSPVGFDVRE